jgi:hypothetical protein
MPLHVTEPAIREDGAPAVPAMATPARRMVNESQGGQAVATRRTGDHRRRADIRSL